MGCMQCAQHVWSVRACGVCFVCMWCVWGGMWYVPSAGEMSARRVRFACESVQRTYAEREVRVPSCLSPQLKRAQRSSACRGEPPARAAGSAAGNHGNRWPVAGVGRRRMRRPRWSLDALPSLVTLLAWGTRRPESGALQAWGGGRRILAVSPPSDSGAQSACCCEV